MSVLLAAGKTFSFCLALACLASQSTITKFHHDISARSEVSGFAIVVMETQRGATMQPLDSQVAVQKKM